MNKKNHQLNWQRIFYPIIGIILLGGIILGFFSITAFLSKNFNRVFSADEPNVNPATDIDMTHLELVAKKLHIQLK